MMGKVFAFALGYVAVTLAAAVAGMAQALLSAAWGHGFLGPHETAGGIVAIVMLVAGLGLLPVGMVAAAIHVWREGL